MIEEDEPLFEEKSLSWVRESRDVSGLRTIKINGKLVVGARLILPLTADLQERNFLGVILVAMSIKRVAFYLTV